MTELLGRNFLRALSNAAQRLDSPGDPKLVEAALTALVDAAEALTAGPGEVVVSIAGDAFYLDRRVLPRASTEFRAMGRAMGGRKIDAVTILRGATRRDLEDLAALVAGHSSDLPAGGTVRINQHRGGSPERTMYLGEVLAMVDGLIAGRDADPGVSLLMSTLHAHDEITYHHSVNVCLLAMALGRFASLEEDQVRLLGLGALLHDIGRVVIDQASLLEDGPLTEDARARVRLHPQEGALAIMAASGPGQEVAAAVALEHHLRFDGGGYPALDRRPALFSRMVAVADAYDAMTSHRPHRPARRPSEALQVLADGAGRVHDPDLVRPFIEMMERARLSAG